MEAPQENTNETKRWHRDWTLQIAVSLAVLIAVIAVIPPFTRALEGRR